MSHTSSTSINPPTPTPDAGACACAGESACARGYVKVEGIPEPTLELAVSMAREIMGFHDAAFVKEWYEDMQMGFWRDEKAMPITNWGIKLNRWIRNKGVFEAKRDPKRVQSIVATYKDRKVAEAEALEATRRQTAAQKLHKAIASLTPDDWALCSESGCRQFENGKCRKRELPCSHMVNRRPCQPTECPDYTNKNN